MDKFVSGLKSVLTPKGIGAAFGLVLVLAALHYFRLDPESLAMKVPRAD